MATIYIPDEIIAKVIATGANKQIFVKEAVEEKLLKKGDN